MANSLISVQVISRSEPSTPSWFREVVLIVEYLRKHGILTKLSEGIRFARKRFGRYEVIKLVAHRVGCSRRPCALSHVSACSERQSKGGASKKSVRSLTRVG